MAGTPESSRIASKASWRVFLLGAAPKEPAICIFAAGRHLGCYVAQAFASR